MQSACTVTSYVRVIITHGVATNLAHISQKVLVRGTGEHTCRVVHCVGIDNAWKQHAQHAVFSHSMTARMLRDDLERQLDGDVKVVPSREAIQREMDEVCYWIACVLF